MHVEGADRHCQPLRRVHRRQHLLQTSEFPRGQQRHRRPRARQERAQHVRVLDRQNLTQQRDQRGTRRLRGQAFQTGMLSTAREADELLLAVRFPRARPGQGFAFHEVARRHGDFAIVALAVSADASGATLAVGGVADTPALCKLGLSRGGSGISGAELDAALNAFAWEMGGNDDLHATARYRRELVRRLAPGLIAEALQRRGAA